MTLRSMTGFGQAILEANGSRVKVEMKSVNHRFFEANCRLPRDWMVVEDDIRTLLHTEVSRGRMDVFVQVDELVNAPALVSVDWALFDAFVAVEAEANRRIAASELQHSVHTWLTYPGVLRVEAVSPNPEQVRSLVMEAVQQALSGLVAMRVREGDRLGTDLRQKVIQLEVLRENMKSHAETVRNTVYQRLKERLLDVEAEVDEQRLWSEVALLAERSSIDEELVRLGSHITEFHRSLVDGSPVGRKLDFIVQEMHREVNTIGSKSSDVHLSKAVIEAKALVEQLREQVQNIE